jgi:hypothetical protein
MAGQERESADDIERGGGPARDPEIENPGSDASGPPLTTKTNRGDNQQELPKPGEDPAKDEPAKRDRL